MIASNVSGLESSGERFPAKHSALPEAPTQRS